MSSLLERAQAYVTKVGMCYLSFVIPVGVFLVFNSAADTLSRDPEKFGALWLHYSRLSPDERNEVYSAGSAAGQQATAAADMLA